MCNSCNGSYRAGATQDLNFLSNADVKISKACEMRDYVTENFSFLKHFLYSGISIRDAE